jgi:hypothetical protein
MLRMSVSDLLVYEMDVEFGVFVKILLKDGPLLFCR